MAKDVIAKCISANVIDNGGILVNAPKGGDQLASSYQRDTYSSTGIYTGLIYDQYDPRFTGIDPCDACLTTAAAGAGGGGVFWA